MPLSILQVTTVDLTAFAFLRPWFQTLRANGHRVTLATTVGNFREPLTLVTDEIVHLPMSRKISPKEDLHSLVALTKLMRRLRPDVVHSYTSKAGLLCRLAARLAGVPLIIHTIYDLPQNATQNRPLKFFYHWAERLAALWAHHLTTISYANEAQILSEQICSKPKLTTIQMGLDLAEFVPAQTQLEVRQAWGLPNDAFVIGTAARLEPNKGHRFLLQAFANLAPQHPNLYLVCIGSGHLEATLREQAQELDIAERVIFTGWIQDLVSAMNAVDLFVLPTLYEGLGMVLLEAMALNKACVSTRVGGTQDVVVDGETGLFVPPRDPNALAQALETLILNPERREQMGLAGRHRVETQFRAEIASARMLALYNELAARFGLRP